MSRETSLANALKTMLNADVRFVYHYNMPKNLESFYQEAGRCGRDGSPAKSVVFYRRKDEDLLRWLVGQFNRT